MNAAELRAKLLAVYEGSSLYQTNRDYLGMSGVGECPRAWYWRTVEPVPCRWEIWCAWTGYMHEARILELFEAGPMRREVVAEFDKRYRGHTDHEISDGTLIEIKSVSWAKYLRLFQARGDKRNRAQCQAYMRHGKFPHAILIYVARDIPWEAFSGDVPLPFFTVDVWRDEAWMDELDNKARRLLACIDSQTPPPCTCGRCRR